MNSYREQAHSYMGSALPTKPGVHWRSLWEPSLLAMAVCQPAWMLADEWLSRAGSLLHGIGVAHKTLHPLEIPVGAELARDGGVSADIDVG
ncbi:hypothetical protein CS078_03335 [Pseudomonas prosekii]|uniref:Uncharacterized protein n=1 Tax=Pseudomonas prosekii TaxID=1148509 RepID=A0A3L8CWV5_9PSED|nr:hypothetical protein CS076_12425 [Pseudomonas prosekii]RLU12757.1 hypothetical protein CS078_03335 [Pseudomonas prosekii]